MQVRLGFPLEEENTPLCLTLSLGALVETDVGKVQKVGPNAMSIAKGEQILAYGEPRERQDPENKSYNLVPEGGSLPFNLTVSAMFTWEGEKNVELPVPLLALIQSFRGRCNQDFPPSFLRSQHRRCCQPKRCPSSAQKRPRWGSSLSPNKEAYGKDQSNLRKISSTLEGIVSSR